MKIFLSAAIISLLLVSGSVGVVSADATKKIQDLKDQAANLNQLKSTDAEDVIGQGINILMMFMGAIMFALVVYGGGLWMTAGGNNEQITKAKNIIIWSALGVMVMLASYIVINFVFTQVAG
jgi:hypothetical protein